MIVLPVFNGNFCSYSTIDKHAANADWIVQRNALGSDYVEGPGDRAGISVGQSEQLKPDCLPDPSFIPHASDLFVNPGKSALSGEIMNFQRRELPKVKIITASRRGDSASQSAMLLKHFQEVSHSIVELGEMVKDEAQVFFTADSNEGISQVFVEETSVSHAGDHRWEDGCAEIAGQDVQCAFE